MRNDPARSARGTDDRREAFGPIITAAREHVHARAIAADHRPVAIELDLMKPIRAARRLAGIGGKARVDESGAGNRDATGTQHHRAIAAPTDRINRTGFHHDRQSLDSLDAPQSMTGWDAPTTVTFRPLFSEKADLLCSS